MLRDELNKYELLFDGTVVTWKKKPADIELYPGSKPYHTKPYPVPRAHKSVFWKDAERLCQLGVLKMANCSEWGSTTFIQPKNNGMVIFLSDFRKINQKICRKPFLIPKIQDMTLKLEGLTYASSLDLNMGYYHIYLSPGSK